MMHRLHRFRLTAIASIGLAAACGNDSDGPAGTGGRSAVLVGAGDIARCNLPMAEATAKLLDDIPGTVITLGDNTQHQGTRESFENCYDPTWGRHKDRTRPSVGNHEYEVPGAVHYYEYFGAAAGDPSRGYYSYDVGDWHVIVLNSNRTHVPTAKGSEQETWLRADLAANDKKCVLAYWHHPRFYHGANWNRNASVKPFWDALYEAGADVVLNAHFHLYERYAPQGPNGEPDPDGGIRQFTVGTGGQWHDRLHPPAPNLEVRDNTTHGVLKLTLESEGYAWQFVPIEGGSFTDSGRGSCH